MPPRRRLCTPSPTARPPRWASKSCPGTTGRASACTPAPIPDAGAVQPREFSEGHRHTVALRARAQGCTQPLRRATDVFMRNILFADIDVILFDMDGTLVNSTAAVERA